MTQCTHYRKPDCNSGQKAGFFKGVLTSEVRWSCSSRDQNLHIICHSSTKISTLIVLLGFQEWFILTSPYPSAYGWVTLSRPFFLNLFFSILKCNVYDLSCCVSYISKNGMKVLMYIFYISWTSLAKGTCCMNINTSTVYPVSENISQLIVHCVCSIF